MASDSVQVDRSRHNQPDGDAAQMPLALALARAKGTSITITSVRRRDDESSPLQTAERDAIVNATQVNRGKDRRCSYAYALTA